MKKVLCVLLLILVAFAFVSCKSEPEKKPNTVESVSIYDQGHSDWLTTIEGISGDVYTWEDLAKASVNHFDFVTGGISYSHIAVVDGGVVVVSEDGTIIIPLDDATYTRLKSTDSIQERVYLHLDV